MEVQVLSRAPGKAESFAHMKEVCFMAAPYIYSNDFPRPYPERSNYRQPAGGSRQAQGCGREGR